MKLSVSLPEEDVEFLDRYAKDQGIESRSGAVQKAVRLLKAAELGPAYEDAWADWEENEDSSVWDETTGDGIA